ncbi:hypothetical protein [Bacillus sp. P14.5]|uniref:hypothetical protein n=1 Tax=Bacillus sp. P14.5 TaxID=1983400 RepID=UPI0013B067AD|nr:hypothetical protein [Bacillus sp. P14.5]
MDAAVPGVMPLNGLPAGKIRGVFPLIFRFVLILRVNKGSFSPYMKKKPLFSSGSSQIRGISPAISVIFGAFNEIRGVFPSI